MRCRPWLVSSLALGLALALGCDAPTPAEPEALARAALRGTDAGECGLPTGACTVDAECDDGCFCSGVEVCRAGTCVRGEVHPCEDDLACTDHECLEETDSCAPVPIDERCDDGDASNGREVCDAAEGCVRESGDTFP